MKDEITRLLVAGQLAMKDYPWTELPRVAPMPYHHLGHHVLADYDKIAMTLWGAALEIRERVVHTRKSFSRDKLFKCAAAGVALSIILLALDISPAYAIIFGAIAAAVTHKYMKTYLLERMHRKLHSDVAYIRLQNLEAIIAGTEPPSFSVGQAATSGAEMVAWDDGSMGESTCPVLVATETDPFPGYGWCQQSQVFTFRPKNLQKRTPGAPIDISTKIDELLDELSVSVGLDVQHGHVVVLHGASLSRTSKWLDEAGRPLMRITKLDKALSSRDRETAESTDPNASVRVYSSIQVAFPRYLTCVTFFLRSFRVGDAAAVEVSVSTLGPPRFTWSEIKKCMAKCRTTAAGEDYEHAIRTPSRWLSADLPTIERLDPHQANTIWVDDLTEMNAIFKGAADEWPGKYYQIENWRRQRSLPMTMDYFGRTECRAAVRVIYNRICRGIFDQLDKIGFDVSDYKDDSGRLLINAERIEQMVMGENIGSIHMTGESKQHDERTDGESKNNHGAKQG